MTRVVVVDDQPLMRSASRTILEAAAIEVVGEAADGDEALAVVGATRPDVVLMDLRMPGRDGIAATIDIVRRHPATRVLVLTTFDEDAHVDAALRAGAAGFLLKNASPEDLVRAVTTVAAGDGVLDPMITARVMARVAAAAPATATTAHQPALARLTEREKDVLHLLGAGCTNAEIAERLHVGEATAKTHVSRVLAKLGVRDRVQAVIVAYESGFATVPRPARLSRLRGGSAPPWPTPRGRRLPQPPSQVTDRGARHRAGRARSWDHPIASVAVARGRCFDVSTQRLGPVRRRGGGGRGDARPA